MSHAPLSRPAESAVCGAQVNQKYALEHQMLVVECMEDPDETLKRKTLELLFRMTNASNVVFVVDKLVSHLRATTDTQFRAGLTEKITQLAERCESPRSQT